MEKAGRRIEIRGTVQGVGFRPWVWQLAQRRGVGGRVRNDSRGVVIDAFGSTPELDAFTDSLGRDLPPAANVRAIDWRAIPFEEVSDFAIVASERARERNVSIPPDLATCDDCLRELLDPNDRRHRYPFINCTNCGPRYTIVRDVPYDRAKTTMTPFLLCDACRAEYEDPRNRRFHAQPNACPACGPRVTVVTPRGREIATGDPIGCIARSLRAQLIAAVKGLGGFHLACDATSSLAVQRLRERKHRDAKPFAVMVRDLDMAERLAELNNEERRALTSPERPVVLVRRRPGVVAPEVADDNPLIGLFLPYTPLHHLLLRDCGIPLVMTSGNRSDEPMVTRNAEALEQLGEIADLFLLHNRDIETRADDSVVRVIANAPVVFRRARGFVPRSIELATPFAEPVLAVGAHLKNAVCIGAGRHAFLGPHVGDLETVATYASFEAGIEQLTKFTGVAPRLVAHDLHPDYLSTRWARQSGLQTIAVQHHHAHIVSAMAEHGLHEQVVGIAYDGTGYGTDGTAWGGEFLRASRAGFTRLATFRAIPLAGGEQAIRQVWRIALALLDDAFDGEPPLHAIPLFRDVRSVDAIRRMIAHDVNTPRARGIGRYFDAFGAIGLSMPHARYEGEVALLWNLAADANERGRYAVVIRDGQTPWEIDFRPAMKSAAEELIRGVSPSTISARFHNTLAAVTIEVARAANPEGLPFVLSGGCFQNARLAESVLRGLRGAVMNHNVPPGDGGLALGQAVIAGAMLEVRGSRAEGRGQKFEPRTSNLEPPKAPLAESANRDVPPGDSGMKDRGSRAEGRGQKFEPRTSNLEPPKALPCA